MRGSSSSELDALPDTGERPRGERLRFEAIAREHLDALSALFERNSTAAVTDTFDPFPLSAEQACKIASAKGRDRHYLAWRASDAVGFSMLRGFDEGYAVPSFGVFVDRAAHGAGIGRALTVWTVEQARALDCPAVRLSVYASNVAALALYRSLGFAEREREPVRRRGAADEKIVMSLDLEAGHG